ncbi:MAG TPA: hypothetical protein VFN10_18255 [Thermoanaerobaculia bacterium]|nr:hypothetical protein [Thermoanaerobaculia bacterium]
MKVIRGRAEGRWLPSRHRFALFRLYAFVRLLTAKPEPQPGLLLIVDRDQASFEKNVMSAWALGMVTCYVAVAWFSALSLPLALLVALPVAAIVIEVPMWGFGLLLGLFGSYRNVKLQSVWCMTLLLLLASWFAMSARWIRFVAWQFLALLALNALCAVVLFFLRAPIARLESTFGGDASAV